MAKRKQTQPKPNSSETKPASSKTSITNEKKSSTRSSRQKQPTNYSSDSDSHSPNKFESPMLASNYDGSQDIKGWLMSEKLDGVRCIWDGKHLISRNGNKFYPPEFFIEKFPKDILLDGELFLDRGKFSETISIVKKQEAHDGWINIKYLVFDAPNIKGNFEKRLAYLKEAFRYIDSSFIQLHQQEYCSGPEEIEKKMDEVLKVKGEGLIVRDPKSLYENRRVKSMLKVKKFHDDEAVVLSHHKGTGRLSHTLGAIEVRNKAGIIFRIGSGFTDKERSKPPKIGSSVTYRYFELSKDGVPRFPTFMREFTAL